MTGFKSQYGIQHRPTGCFLPTETRPTDWIPGSWGSTPASAPRLTANLRTAKQLATTWAKERTRLCNLYDLDAADKAAYDAKRAELDIVEFGILPKGVVK